MLHECEEVYVCIASDIYGQQNDGILMFMSFQLIPIFALFLIAISSSSYYFRNIAIMLEIQRVFAHLCFKL